MKVTSSFSSIVLFALFLVVASPSSASAKTFYCKCISGIVLVDPEFTVEARCGIDANKAAKKQCKADGYDSASCYRWDDESDDECEIEAELLLEIIESVESTVEVEGLR